MGNTGFQYYFFGLSRMEAKYTFYLPSLLNNKLIQSFKNIRTVNIHSRTEMWKRHCINIFNQNNILYNILIQIYIK